MRKVFAGLLVMLVAFSLFAQPPHKAHPPRVGVPMWVGELDLTKDQVKRIRDLHFKHREAMLELRTQLEKKEMEFEKLILADNFDEKAIMKVADEIAQLRAEKFRVGIRFRLDMFRVLTPEQREEAKEFLIRGCGGVGCKGKHHRGSH